MILVDTNVLLDIFTDDPAWADWSQQQVDAAALRDRLAINAIVYAELSAGFARIEELDAALNVAEIAVAELPRAALFLAGQAFKAYRQRGGVRTGVLSDFFIGAHAAVLDSPLIARDDAHYRSYFPKVRIIAPARA